MAVTRYGFTGPMAAYGTFIAKDAGATPSTEGFSSMLLLGVGHVWWFVFWVWSL